MVSDNNRFKAEYRPYGAWLVNTDKILVVCWPPATGEYNTWRIDACMTNETRGVWNQTSAVASDFDATVKKINEDTVEIWDQQCHEELLTSLATINKSIIATEDS